ncbi:MAG: TRAP transporter small permease [Defluviitaleaceae bacterium]|nr:TRAP transporter small permease [Defluviitaleaceae bacterium]
MGAVKRVLYYFDRSVEIVMFFCVAGFASVAFTQVFFRYALNNSIPWAEELCRYLFVWLVFLGAGLGVVNRSHIAVDAIPNLIPKRFKKYYQVMIDVAVLVVSVLLLRYGYTLAMLNFEQSSPALQIPIGYVYFGIIVGAVIMIVNSLRVIVAGLWGVSATTERPSAAMSEQSGEAQ